MQSDTTCIYTSRGSTNFLRGGGDSVTSVPAPPDAVIPELAATDAAAAMALLSRMDARDCAEAVGLAPYWGFDTNRDGGGKPRPVLRPAQFERGTR